MQEYESLYKVRCKKLINEGLVLEELNNYENFKDILDEENFARCIKNKQNRKNKRYRTKEKFLQAYRIAHAIKGSKVVFGTCTLNDYYLSLKEDTYIRKLDSWLKKHFDYVILNKDFGTKTEREHYHFIGVTIEELEDKHKKSKTGYEVYELVNKDYILGFEPTLCLVNLDINDIEKTINYLLKLNNHSNKLSTKNRVRVLKSNRADLVILLNNLEPKKVKEKQKKSFYEKIKYSYSNPSYDTLNKRSVSLKGYQDISVEEFITFLDSNKDIADF